MNDDSTLLRRFAEEKSSEAFGELVQRHLDFVFSAALREVGGDFARAQDITQNVFVALARKASVLHRRATLVGWLHVSVHHAAAELMRNEQRRQRREQEASAMLEQSGSSIAEDDWSRLQPVLNEVVGELGEVERDAILLRFYQKRSLVEIGATLHVSEDAAQKRVARALEKMRSGLVRRGITSTSAALGIMLQNHAVAAAPAGLLGTITQGALAKAGTGGMAAALSWCLGKLPLTVAAVVVLSGATTIALRRRAPPPAHDAHPAPPVEQAIAFVGSTNDPARAQPDAPPAEQPADVQPSANATNVAAMLPPAPKATPSFTANQMNQWFAAANDPQEIVRQSTRGRELILQRYSYLIDRFTLTATEKEDLLRLLDDKRQVPLDLFVASLQQGIDPRKDPEAFEQRVTVERAAIEKEIGGLLGDARYRDYKAYNRRLNEESVMMRLGATVRGTENALTPDQTAQLELLLRLQRPPAQTITAAQGFLTPVQIDALREVFALKQAVKTKLPDDVPPPDDGQE
jgi:RNA polymerase sigma factor (sigma-70 family)